MVNINQLVIDGKIPSLYSYLEEIPDYRTNNHLKKYKLADLLLVMILAIMSGYCTQRQISEFCINQNGKLITPSKSLINRTLINLDYDCFGNKVKLWLRSLADCVGFDTVSIDGKSSNGFLTNNGKTNCDILYTVSCYCSQIGIVYDFCNLQGSKGSESQVARSIINHDNIKIITGDAIHTNQFTMKQIVNSGKDYIFNAKRKGLLRSLIHQTTNMEGKVYLTKNKVATVYELPKDFKAENLYIYQTSKQLLKIKNVTWKDCGIKTFIKIVTKRKDKYYTRFYVSSLVNEPEFFLQKVTEHWKIENGLHLPKDKVFCEDNHFTRNLQSTCVFSCLMSLIISIYHITVKESIKKATQKYCNRVDSCLTILGISNTVLLE